MNTRKRAFSQSKHLSINMISYSKIYCQVMFLIKILLLNLIYTYLLIHNFN